MDNLGLSHLFRFAEPLLFDGALIDADRTGDETTEVRAAAARAAGFLTRGGLHGIDGLRPKRSAYSPQFKMQVLTHQDREQLSSRQVAAVYDIRIQTK